MLWAATPLAVRAQTFTNLHSFDVTDGANPTAALVQGTDGSLYGTTNYGGTSSACSGGCGTLFRITPSGTLTTLHGFDATDGANPFAALVQAANGNFYGTTGLGGADDEGTVFKVTREGAFTKLYDFSYGAGPNAVVRALDGTLYGTTGSGGANGFGTVFKLTQSGTWTTLYSFCAQSGCTDGAVPGSLIQGSDGDFYGTTVVGGANSGCELASFGNCGTVFKITPTGTLTTLYNFCSRSGCADGENPGAGLVQGTDGNLYGTTDYGGANGDGTVFKITSGGTLTTLYSFCSETACADGTVPVAALVHATDGNFYGTTSSGGANGGGTIFEMTPNGTLTTLYSFCSQTNCTDGFNPSAALVEDTSGTFYGTTYDGGLGISFGTVFSISVGLGPFVETQPEAAPVGTTVEILGTDLMGATYVAFNGTAATFTVGWRSAIQATVPAGATTGRVRVTTPHGTFLSNVPFRVLQ